LDHKYSTYAIIAIFLLISSFIVFAQISPPTNLNGYDIRTIKRYKIINGSNGEFVNLSAYNATISYLTALNMIITNLITENSTVTDLTVSNIIATNATISVADITNATIDNATITYITASSTVTTNATIDNATIDYGSISVVDITNATIDNASITYNTISITDIENATVKNINITNPPVQCSVGYFQTYDTGLTRTCTTPSIILNDINMTNHSIQHIKTLCFDLTCSGNITYNTSSEVFIFSKPITIS